MQKKWEGPLILTWFVRSILLISNLMVQGFTGYLFLKGNGLTNGFNALAPILSRYICTVTHKNIQAHMHMCMPPQLFYYSQPLHILR